MADLRKKLGNLLEKPIFTAAQARKKGITSAQLAYYCKQGIIERVAHGVYRNKQASWEGPADWEEIALIAASIPKGILCLLTALSYYDLTDEFVREIWVAVPKKTWPPERPHTHIVRMNNTTLGTTKIKIGNVPLKIFNRERTIVDCFRYAGTEIAIKALKEYLKGSKEHKPDLSQLSRYAKKLRTRIDQYVEAITT